MEEIRRYLVLLNIAQVFKVSEELWLTIKRMGEDRNHSHLVDITVKLIHLIVYGRLSTGSNNPHIKRKIEEFYKGKPNPDQAANFLLTEMQSISGLLLNRGIFVANAPSIDYVRAKAAGAISKYVAELHSRSDQQELADFSVGEMVDFASYCCRCLIEKFAFELCQKVFSDTRLDQFPEVPEFFKHLVVLHSALVELECQPDEDMQLRSCVGALAEKVDDVGRLLTLIDTEYIEMTKQHFASMAHLPMDQWYQSILEIIDKTIAAVI